MADTKGKVAGDSVTVTVQGRLGRDVEVRTSRNGKRISRTAIAIGQRKKNAAGHWEDDVTMWLEAVAFGSDMDTFEKGDKVLISGRLAYREWEGRQGDTMKTWEVLVDSATLISKPKPKAETDLPNTSDDDYPE